MAASYVAATEQRAYVGTLEHAWLFFLCRAQLFIEFGRRGVRSRNSCLDINNALPIVLTIKVDQMQPIVAYNGRRSGSGVIELRALFDAVAAPATTIVFERCGLGAGNYISPRPQYVGAGP